MLSPSHPGPHKATHLAMCDRTFSETVLVTPVTIPVSVFAFVADSVGVERCSTTTGYRSDNRTLLAANEAADYSSCTSTSGGG